MTLRIEISIIPFGDESKKRVIETVNVSNVTFSEGDRSDKRHKYVVEHNSYKQYDKHTPRVSHLRESGAIALAATALGSLINTRLR